MTKEQQNKTIEENPFSLSFCDSRCPCGGGKHRVFRCQCGREQTYQPAEKSGGITEKEAMKVGWTLYDRQWFCSYCSGNTDMLDKIFNQ